MPDYNLGTAAGRIVVDGSGASAGFSVAQTAAQGFLDAIQSKVQAVKDLGDRLTRVGATGVAGFGIAVKAASKFEQQMSFVEAVSGATEKQMEAVRQKALDLGASTAYSATEAGMAMEELVKAGLSVDDVLNGAADATVNLAAAGGVELPKAAEIASNAMNQFELDAKDMPKVADLIAGAANASAISVEEFGFSLSQAGAVANLTGLDFDDLAVAIAEMGQAGIKGSDAGTSLKTFLTNLIPVTTEQIKKFHELRLITVGGTEAMQRMSKLGIKPASDSFSHILIALRKYVELNGGAKVGTDKNKVAAFELGQELGVLQNSFFDANGEAKSMKDIQEVLQESTKDLTKQQKLASLEILFGSDAIRAAAVLADEGAEGYTEMAKAMGKVKAADVAATRLDNLSGAVEEMKGAFETALITIGSVFIPIVRKVVEWITHAVNAFNKMPQGLQTAIIAIFGVGTAMTLLIGVAIKLAFILGPLLAQFLGFRALRAVWSILTAGWAVYRAGAGATAALAASQARAAVVMGRLNRAIQASIIWCRRFIATSRAMAAAWAFVTGPWGIAIALIVAAGILLYNTFEPFKNLIDDLVAVMKGAFYDALEAVENAMHLVADGFRSGKAEGQGLQKFFTATGAVVRGLWERLKDLWDLFKARVIPVLKECGRVLRDQLYSTANQVWNTVQTQLIPALDQLWKTIQTDVVPAMQTMWEKGKPLVDFIVKWGGTIVKVLLWVLFKVAEIIIKYVIPAILWLYTHIAKYIIIALGWLAEKLIVVISWLVKAATKAIEFGKRIWDAFSQYALPVIKKLVHWIGGLLWGALQYVWSALNEYLIPALKEAWKVFKEQFGAAIQSVWRSIKENLLPALKELWSSFKESLLPALKELWNQIEVNILPVLMKLWELFKQYVVPVLKEIGKYLLIVIGVLIAIVPVIVGLVVVAFLYFVGIIIKYVLPVIVKIWTWFQKYIWPVVAFVWDVVTAVVGFLIWLVAKIVWFVGQAIKFFSNFSDNMGKIWDAIVAWVRKKWNQMKDYIFQKVVQIAQYILRKWNQIKDWTSDKWNQIKNWVVRKAVELFNGVVDAIMWLPRKAREYFGKFKDGAQDKVRDLLRYARDIPSKIKNAIGNLGSLLKEAGKDILRGLISGIVSKIGDLRAKLGEITDLIPFEKGPPRKDRVLLEENGRLIMEGLVQGIVNGEDALVAALRGLTAAIPGVVAGAYSGVAAPVSRTPIERFSEAATAPTVVNTTINNPVAEKGSDSVAKRLRTLSSAGVI